MTPHHAARLINVSCITCTQVKETHPQSKPPTAYSSIHTESSTHPAMAQNDATPVSASDSHTPSPDALVEQDEWYSARQSPSRTRSGDDKGRRPFLSFLLLFSWSAGPCARVSVTVRFSCAFLWGRWRTQYILLDAFALHGIFWVLSSRSCFVACFNAEIFLFLRIYHLSAITLGRVYI